ncbi:hypothetical protein MMALV_04850 [Candidatus Methanomethylophilus alvi Mx1201]|uniref:Uncharacterized protein n=1 Tax=Methanomethylophilus alvi (strain Mx1201) TaxID=1236689 RepID=M9SI34_METAX|nr:hypothetical protein MMALV_04850 [Candidatus Methanomethylophilus alvi Mx1201]
MTIFITNADCVSDISLCHRMPRALCHIPSSVQNPNIVFHVTGYSDT